MTEQQPTRFENYPPETSAAPSAGADPAPTPPPALYLPPQPAVQPPRTQSRRSVISALIGLAVGVPVIVAVGASAFERTDTEAPGSWTMNAEPSVDEDDDPQIETPSDLTLGDYTAAVPSGWELTSSDDTKAVLTRDANQVTVMLFGAGSDDPGPVEDIAEAVRNADTGFRGSPGKPVDESTDVRELASLSAKGTFQGKSARQFAELWLDDNGDYLLIVTVLTAAEGSPVARQATSFGSTLTAGLR